MKMFTLLVRILCSVSIILMTIDGLIDNTPYCFDSCSNEVPCSVSQYINLCKEEPQYDAVDGPDISGEPVDLQVVKLHDSDHQFLQLSWRPPKDGSYNYLRGYLVQVTVISTDHAHSDATDTICYKILPASNWPETHRKLSPKGGQGVSFFLNCIRTTAAASLDIFISIHSLPLRADAPKLATTTVAIRPESAARSWNPQLKKWVDASDVMHLIIENPLREAQFYDVQIQSVRTGHVVFSQVFQTSLGNRNQDNFSTDDQTGKPHFLLPGLSMGDNYTILMDVLDENKTQIPNFPSVETIPFSLNFSRQPQPVVAADQQVLTTHHILIIVGLIAVAAAVVLACLAIRGPLKSSTIRALVGGTSYKPVQFKFNLSPSFVPIYCHESDNFVAAVKSHVNLLRRCIHVLTASSNSQQTCFISLCGASGAGQIHENCTPKLCDTVIYLSPGLRNLLTSDPQTSSISSPVDVKCMEALKTLREFCSDDKVMMIHLVTFDCFSQSEIAFLDELTAFLFPHQQNMILDPLPHLKLTNLSSGVWRVHNLEQLLLNLFRLREFPADMARRLENWGDCSEAEAVERCFLCLVNESPTLEKSETFPPQEQCAPTVVFDVECAHYSTRDTRTVGRNELSNSESLDFNLQSCTAKDTSLKSTLKLHQGILPTSQVRGRTERTETDITKSCQLRVSLPLGSVHSQSVFHYTNYLSPLHSKDYVSQVHDKDYVSQVHDKDYVSQVHDKDYVSQVHDKDYVSQVHDKDYVSQVHDKDYVSQVHDKDHLSQLHNKDHVSQVHDNDYLSQLHDKNHFSKFYDKVGLSKFHVQDCLSQSHEGQRLKSEPTCNYQTEPNCQTCFKLDCQDNVHLPETMNQCTGTRSPESCAFYSTKFYNQTDKGESSGVCSLDSDCMVNGHFVDGDDGSQNGFVDKSVDTGEGDDALLTEFWEVRGRCTIVPPSLSQSSFATIGSVCERLNQINDNSGWGESGRSDEVHSCWSEASLSQ